MCSPEGGDEKEKQSDCWSIPVPRPGEQKSDAHCTPLKLSASPLRAISHIGLFATTPAKPAVPKRSAPPNAGTRNASRVSSQAPIRLSPNPHYGALFLNRLTPVAAVGHSAKKESGSAKHLAANTYGERQNGEGREELIFKDFRYFRVESEHVQNWQNMCGIMVALTVFLKAIHHAC